MTAPPVPTGGPDLSWPHRKLYERTIDALHALPSRFRTALRIAGISATDLFTLNTPLGAAIEQSVVESLNTLRELWDPDEEYQRYSFVRQSQAFPDVRLQTSAPSIAEFDRILLGIELKGWFVLSKEGEPSFRYKASPASCAPQDLLVVYPWQLDEVISGSPRLMRPFISEARYAAEHRNFYWEFGRGVTGPNAAVKPAPAPTPYPSKGQKSNDEAMSDSGGNFGRVARGGLMTEFIETLMDEPISGVPARYWQTFLRTFAEGAGPEMIDRRLKLLRASMSEIAGGTLPNDALDKIEAGIRQLIERS